MSNDNDESPVRFAITIPPEAWPVRVNFQNHEDFTRFIHRRDGSSAPDPTAPHVTSVLLSVKEASELLGITKSALYSRVERGQVKGVVRTGRRMQFHREVLLTKLQKGAKLWPSRCAPGSAVVFRWASSSAGLTVRLAGTAVC